MLDNIDNEWCDEVDDIDLLFPDTYEESDYSNGFTVRHHGTSDLTEAPDLARHEPELNVAEKNFLVYLCKFGSINDDNLPAVDIGETDTYAEVIKSLLDKGLIERGRDQVFNGVTILSNRALNLFWDRL
jgi:hypothetical protein